MLLRRDLVAQIAAAVALVGCGVDAQANLDRAKAYLNAGIGATLASGQQYLAGPPKPSAAAAVTVQAGIDRLEKLQALLDSLTAPTDWKAAATEATAMLAQLAPILLPQLGPAGEFIPLVIAFVNAFVAGLPPPPAPATPPPALSRKALEYHRR